MADPAASMDWIDQLPRRPGPTPDTEYVQSPADNLWYQVPKAAAPWQPPPTAPAPPPEPGLLERAWDKSKAFAGEAAAQISPAEMFHENPVASAGRAIDRYTAANSDSLLTRTIINTAQQHSIPTLITAAMADRSAVNPETQDQQYQITASDAAPSPGFVEGLKAFGKVALEHPGTAVGQLVQQTAENPQYLLGGDLGLTAGAARIARAASAGESAQRAAAALGRVAGNSASFAGLSAATEALHEAGDGAIDPDKVKTEAEQGAATGPVFGELLRIALRKPTIRATLNELKKGLDTAPAGEPAESRIQGPSSSAGPENGPERTVGGSGGSPTGTLSELLDQARAAGVSSEDLQPIMSDRLRRNISDEEARSNVSDLISQAGKVQSASADSTPAAAGSTPSQEEALVSEPATAAPSEEPKAATETAQAPTPDENGIVKTEVAGQPVEVNVEPTALQKASGNYQKGHVELHGIPITIENPKGTTRSGADSDGTAWESTLQHDYGYVKRTLGADGDHVDTFIGPNPESTRVFVVDQHVEGKFDEHKAMLGFKTRAAAVDAYNSNYPTGWKGAKHVTPMSIEQFKDWLKNGDTTQPARGAKLTAPQPTAAVGEGKSAVETLSPADETTRVAEALSATEPGTKPAKRETPAVAPVAPKDLAGTAKPVESPAPAVAVRGNGELSADATERLADPAIRDEMRRMGQNAYWDEIGGKGRMDSEGAMVGTTKWLPHEPWFKDELAQNERLGKGDREYGDVIEDAIAGKPLKKAERRMVERFSEIAESHVKGTLDEDTLAREAHAREVESHASQLKEDSAHDEYAQHLRDIIQHESEQDTELDAIARRETEGDAAHEDQRQEAPGGGEGGAGESAGQASQEGSGEGAGPAPAAPRRSGPVDLFGDDTRIAQEIADETRRRDAARNSGQDSLETGRPDDLFSQARGQVDLVDQAGGKSARGTDTGPPAERHSLEPDAADSGRAAAVLDDGRAEESRPGTAVSESDAQRDLAPSGGELPGASPAYGGERGDLQVRAPEERSGAADAAAGDLFAGRGDADSGQLAADEPTGEAAALETAAATRPTLSFQRADKLAAQRAAESIPIEHADAKNIAATLPFLLPQQHEDVHFAEKRFAKPEGYGVLFTNGTGTGKTFVGLGVIKRLVRSGKKNGLIVVPSQKIATDWMRSGKDLGLDIQPLSSTTDAGKGLSITTYANLGENDTLADRKLDFVVSDEAHSLMQNAAAGGTAALDKVRALTYHPDGRHTRARMVHRVPYRELVNLQQEVAQLAKARQRPPPELLEKEAQALRTYAALEEAQIKMDSRVTGAERPRALFMSATPFAYEKNVSWAHGYLFNYPEVTGRGYNTPDPFGAFMIQHFGYRMRTGKLTQPGPEVDSALMQRQFNMWLRKEGVLGARMLDVDKDYDRKFVLSESRIGNAIDEGMDYLREHERGKYSPLLQYLKKSFDFLARSRLLEALKARESVPYIRRQLKLGRKIVVFYDYNEGGGTNIFDIKPPGGEDELSSQLRTLINEFRDARPDLVALNTQAESPLATLKKAFPQALEYNGLVAAKRRTGFVDAFNNDAMPEANLILAQKAANAGWSAHDTTGKHPRVLINLGLPTAPTVAIQQEGRIYRVGQASDAMFRYFNTGTSWERWAFATTIAGRASTAENLAMGEQARGLRDAFIEAFENSGSDAPGSADDGKGGKSRDRALVEATSDFDKARSFYFGQQKKTARTKSEEGVDYFATPEPLGLKMVEWAGIRPTDDLLEPSAGHGAIARWFPEHNKRTVIEPSRELASRLALVTDAKILNDRFEDLHAVNKFDAIVMNPPFGSGGSTAIEHLAKAVTHLRDGGRVVALIPEGPAADKKFDKWFQSDEAKGVYKVREFGLPTIAFERAGTAVKARVVILDKLSEKAQAHGARIEEKSRSDISGENVRDFFNAIRDREAPDRPIIPESAKSLTNAEALRESGVSPASSADAASSVAFDPFDGTHSKTGAPVFYAVPKARVGTEQYRRWSAAAKALGGYYSPFRGSGAKAGFLFKTPAARDKFMQEQGGQVSTSIKASYRRGGQVTSGELKPNVSDYLTRVKNALQGYANLRVHPDTESLSRAIGQEVPADVTGAYTSDDGALHLIASRLPDIETAQAYVRHELFGHLAMERSPDFEKALSMVGKLRDLGGQRINALYNEAKVRYPQADETTLRKEVIAAMAERGIKNAIVDRAITGVHQILSRLGIHVDPSEAELRQMIVQAARGVPSDARALTGVDRAAAYEVEGHLAAGREGAAQDAMGRVLPESEALDALTQARRDSDARAIAVLADLSADSPGDVAPGEPEPTEEDAYHPAEASVPGEVLFARHAPMDAAATSTRDRVMPVDGRSNLSLRDRIRLGLKALTNVDGLAVRQYWVDDLASIERYERMLNGGTLQEGAASPLKAARSIRNLASQMAAVLEKGIPEYHAGAYQVVPGRKGLKEVLAPLNANPAGSLITHFELYSAARRASRLITETNRDGTAREKTFTLADIKAGLDLAKQYPELATVFDDLQQVWKQLLDVGVKAGTIDPAARAIYERHGDYVPFYRLDDMLAGGRNPQRARGGIANQREMSGRLTGKAAPLQNILENIMLNIANQLDAAQKNIAAQRVVDSFPGVFATKIPKDTEAVKIGNDQVDRAIKALGLNVDPAMTPQQREAWSTFFRRVAPTDRDVIRVMREGKPEYWRISDPLVLDAMTALQGAPKWLRDLDKRMFGMLSGPKRFYTAMSTATPMYTARRFIRVMLDTWMQSNHQLGLAKNAYRDFYDAVSGHKDLYSMMMAGAGGAQGYDQDPEHVRDMLIKAYKGGNKQNFVLKAASPKTWWDTWRKIQNASKNEHMLRVYRAARTQGASVAEAAFRARDIEDLSMKGGGAIMQFINRSVPFLNPRIQGTYRMVRGFRDNWKAYALRGMAVTMASMGLLAINYSNPKYQELPEWEKDVAWHVFVGDHHFILPKPFELGLIFGTLPERIVRSAAHELGGVGDTAGESADAAKRALLDTFALNPVPQVARPFLEQATNTDTFGNKIVSNALSEQEPQEQYNSFTSPTVRAIASSLPGRSNYVFNSPVRLQAFINSVTGSLGASIIQGTDKLTRHGVGYGDAPSSSITESALKSFYESGEPTSTKYTGELYDFMDQADRAYSSVTKLANEGRMEKAREMYRSREKLIQLRPFLNQIGKRMREISKQEGLITNSPNLSAQEKKTALDKLVKVRNDTARKIAPFEDFF